ncbi:SRPBCC domain-containing protein [Rhizobium sp. SSA_523]|uniref:SRPBCC family protein n=1 Tax=Rhizobium sp. SSA_523 TaxID=2952477 RepID=UPI0020916D31|nr:hypothetical protein [Rhizobium sp. SSA_523]MCO5730560.1 hypothetical protein [Rhizobium sp. SSA_523]WKC25597.1 hypothetical protein QTJ18_16705 [Rhizobium sp. SSA_523]
MKDNKTEEQRAGIDFEYQLDAPTEKVWRALSIPEFRANWLPQDALANPDATTSTPGEEVSYRMRDNTPPFVESTVTFRIAPNESGGTSLRIIHELDVARLDRTIEAANNNSQILMLAA